jgi:two-component system chemotaxis sensor kinase CheA
MDVVKRNIADMGGKVELSSAEGHGTRTTIRLPLTLAILDGLSVAVGEQTFIIPLGAIVESLQITEKELKTVSGEGLLLQVRGEYLPLVALHEIFNIKSALRNWSGGIVVIIETEGKKTALLVDELLGQHQVVIKSLESNFRKVYGMSGATIMGDGRVALILDVTVLGAHHLEHAL